MKKNTILLIFSIILFICTTYVMISLPLLVPNKFDHTQWCIYIAVAVMGYLGSFMYYSVYKAVKKEE